MKPLILIRFPGNMLVLLLGCSYLMKILLLQAAFDGTISVNVLLFYPLFDNVLLIYYRVQIQFFQP